MMWDRNRRGGGVPIEPLPFDAAIGALPLAMPPRGATLLVSPPGKIGCPTQAWPGKETDIDIVVGLDFRFLVDDTDELTGLTANVYDPAIVIQSFSYFGLTAVLTVSDGSPGTHAQFRLHAIFASGETADVIVNLPILNGADVPRYPPHTLLIGGLPLTIGGHMLLME